MNKIIFYIIYIMAVGEYLDNEVSEYIKNFTDNHRGLPNWNNLTDTQRNEVNEIWAGFTLDRQIRGINYRFSMEDLDEVEPPLARQPAGNLSLQEIHRTQRHLLDLAYNELVERAEQQGADNMDIDGGGKKRKTKRRKSLKKSKRKSKRRKSKTRRRRR